jgi:ATP-dependent RNA helicase DeaD
MTTESSIEDLPPSLSGALSRRGFTTLTPIQQAVLEPDTVGRDLRLCSQTGSGKTVAIGLVIARDILSAEEPATTTNDEEVPPSKRGATPAALVVAPTRELAAQLTKELTWLLRASGRTCCAVTGGASYPLQMRALRERPTVVIGTPGRLRDHIERGFIDLSAVRSVVLDEADQMLDMGFREDLEAIVDRAAPGRRMHMASATFPPDAQALAKRYQSDPRAVFGAAPGEVNADISYVAHLVRPADRLAALVNVLLLCPEDRTLVFVRTRADAASLAQQLAEVGFSARPISGDLEQAERTRTLDAFRSGVIKVLVATDVAARGLDIPDVGRVVHADPPSDSEVLTHRSGRTGRAGKKGNSILLVTPAARESVERMISRAKVRAKWTRVPSEEDVWKAADARLRTSIQQALHVEEGEEAAVVQDRMRDLAESLVRDAEDPVALVRELLIRAQHAGPSQPKHVEPVDAPQAKGARPMRRDARGEEAHVAFHINFGTRAGADARRLLAMVCRRGRIQGQHIGAIRIGETFSTFEVLAEVAEEFARSVRKPDPRDPHIRITHFDPAYRGRSAMQGSPVAKGGKERVFSKGGFKPRFKATQHRGVS